MDQKAETERTVGNLREFGEVFIYVFVLAFVLEGLLFACILIYSMVFYRFVSWIQWNEYIGLAISYTIFVIILIIILHFHHKFFHFSKLNFLRGFAGVLAFYSIIFPLTPISWYVTPSPSTGFSYGIEYQLWPLLTLVGLATLVVLIMDFLRVDDSQSYKIMLLFSGILAAITTLVSMLVLSVPPDTNQIDNWATPFFILPHVIGLALLLESLNQYIETRKKSITTIDTVHPSHSNN